MVQLIEQKRVEQGERVEVDGSGKKKKTKRRIVLSRGQSGGHGGGGGRGYRSWGGRNCWGGRN
jgi:hypothetical protein